MGDNDKNGVSRRGFLRNAGVVGAAGAALAVGAIDAASASERKEVAGRTGLDYDVIVIGGGFAGVTAARDSMKNGYRTLLLEARNRLGGRTFSSEFAGHRVELGGTWIHWTQPFVWAETQRYGLKLKETPEPFQREEEHVRLVLNGKSVELEQKDLIAAMQALQAFFADAPKLWERPYDAHHNWKDLIAADPVSVTQRLDQLKLTPLQRSFVDAYMSGIGHNVCDQVSYVEMARWWSLPGWNMTALVDSCGRYSFKDGTVSLINAMIDDSKPEVRLSTPVTKVEDKGDRVLVTTQKGDTLTAGAVIVAVPMNVLPRIDFTPALDPALVEAAKEKHSGSGVKVYVKTKGKLEGKITGVADSAHPLNLTAVYTKAEDHTIFVCFGNDPQKLDIQDREAVQKAFGNLIPDLEVEECYGYEWTLDPFAKGTYCNYKPKWFGKYYDHFQKDRGRVLFGQGDHGEGWRGFIDGAIGAGGKAALRTKTLLG